MLRRVFGVQTGSALPPELSRLLSDSGVVGGGGRGRGGGATAALVELSESGGLNSERFLRSFCRYCHSHPFYCGEMLRLCYA